MYSKGQNQHGHNQGHTHQHGHNQPHGHPYHPTVVVTNPMPYANPHTHYHQPQGGYHPTFFQQQQHPTANMPHCPNTGPYCPPGY